MEVSTRLNGHLSSLSFFPSPFASVPLFCLPARSGDMALRPRVIVRRPIVGRAPRGILGIPTPPRHGVEGAGGEPLLRLLLSRPRMGCIDEESKRMGR